MNVPYLSDIHIEAEASRVLRAHAKRTGQLIEPPIPIDEIVEITLGLSLDYDDLQTRFNGADVLGAYCPRQRAVFVDSSLDPVEHPERETRNRFTLGHEGGHDVVHGHLFRGAPDLFGEIDPGKPSVICRKSAGKARIELQADKFSAFILMPHALVIRHWNDAIRNAGPEFAIRAMARTFKVSKQAMQIRLTDLGLVQVSGSGLWPQSAA